MMPCAAADPLLTWQVAAYEGHVVLLAILGDQQLTNLLQQQTRDSIRGMIGCAHALQQARSRSLHGGKLHAQQ
jgi:hypothetical protein